MSHLILIFILLPFTLITAIIGYYSKQKIWKSLLKYTWLILFGFLFGIFCFGSVIEFFRNKKNVDKSDIYGEYVIDKSKYSGIQSDWQYDHFRFEITKNNEIIFYETDKERILNIYKGKIGFLEAYKKPRLVLYFEGLKHHIMEEKPTLIREVWGFYYVFHSPKFGNVFFKKGHWKPNF